MIYHGVFQNLPLVDNRDDVNVIVFAVVDDAPSADTDFVQVLPFGFRHHFIAAEKIKRKKIKKNKKDIHKFDKDASLKSTILPHLKKTKVFITTTTAWTAQVQMRQRPHPMPWVASPVW